jgi:hypothetical protein
MQKHLFIPVIFFLLSLFITSCDKGDTKPPDRLDDVGLYGVWKLELRSINGISGLIAECCDYLEYQTDYDPDDLKGNFKAHGVGYDTPGTFELSSALDTIEFVYLAKKLRCEIHISDDKIRLIFTQNNDIVEEIWTRLQ